MADVAAAAGVSIKTVSRYVSGSGQVADPTARRIAEAIETLRFRRNEAARQLRQGAPVSIGVLIEDVADPFYGAFVRGIESAIDEHDCGLLLASSGGRARHAHELVATFLDHGVDGLIVVPSVDMDAERLRAQLGPVPIVLADRPLPGVDCDAVLSDNAGGMRDATERLLRAGHASIAYAGDDDRLFTARERRDGFLLALAAAGVAPATGPRVQQAPDDAAAADVLARIAARQERPTALISGNNRWSIALLRAGALDPALGLSFVGFDDFELAGALDPPVSVVAQQPGALGAAAAELVLRRIGGHDGAARRRVLPTAFVSRGSEEPRRR